MKFQSSLGLIGLSVIGWEMGPVGRGSLSGSTSLEHLNLGRSGGFDEDWQVIMIHEDLLDQSCQCGHCGVLLVGFVASYTD